MQRKRFKPLVDKLFWIIAIPTAVLIASATALAALAPTILFVMLPIDLFVVYFLISPLFGYVELGETAVFIKYGFFMKKEIPYVSIRGTQILCGFYAVAEKFLRPPERKIQHLRPDKHQRRRKRRAEARAGAQSISKLDYKAGHTKRTRILLMRTQKRRAWGSLQFFPCPFAFRQLRRCSLVALGAG